MLVHVYKFLLCVLGGRAFFHVPCTWSHYLGGKRRPLATLSQSAATRMYNTQLCAHCEAFFNFGNGRIHPTSTTVQDTRRPHQPTLTHQDSQTTKQNRVLPVDREQWAASNGKPESRSARIARHMAAAVNTIMDTSNMSPPPRRNPGYKGGR
jgi:hypothetical protein